MSTMQQMLFAVSGKEDDVFQVRDFQVASSLTSSNMHPYNHGSNYYQYPDGAFFFSIGGSSRG